MYSWEHWEPRFPWHWVLDVAHSIMSKSSNYCPHFPFPLFVVISETSNQWNALQYNDSRVSIFSSFLYRPSKLKKKSVSENFSMTHLVKCWERRKREKDYRLRDHKLWILTMFYEQELEEYAWESILMELDKQEWNINLDMVSVCDMGTVSYQTRFNILARVANRGRLVLIQCYNGSWKLAGKVEI